MDLGKSSAPLHHCLILNKTDPAQQKKNQAFRSRNASPKTKIPYVASTDKPSGTGFPPVLIARGMELPPSTVEATRPSSSP